MSERTLVLIRHAKAVAGDGPDADRPLSGRGSAEAPAIGRWLGERGVVVARVVVSPALRTIQTWDLAAAELAETPDPVLDRRIYHNTVESLLEVVRATPADVATLVLVGHNPGMHEFALFLDDGTGPVAARDALAAGYPTGAVTILEIPDHWEQVASATVLAYEVAR